MSIVIVLCSFRGLHIWSSLMVKVKLRNIYFLFLFCFPLIIYAQLKSGAGTIHLNDEGYYEAPGINFMMFDDFYPEGHQGGFTIIQCGTRIAANGDIRLEPSPGQWAPVPKMGGKQVDKDEGIISVDLWFPDPDKNQKGFNPIQYPDLKLKYTIRTESMGKSIKLIVDLEKPLPKNLENKIGFNLEFFPGYCFGEHYLMDANSGFFPRQSNGPTKRDEDGNLQSTPLAAGHQLIVAPGHLEKELKIVSRVNELQLIDQRGLHNNGWFVVRSVISGGISKNAIEWIIMPRINPYWKYRPVIQISQVGYHPNQKKFAVIELDKSVESCEPIKLLKINDYSTSIVTMDNTPKLWGRFLRYQYARFDFSDVTDEGLYKIQCGDVESNEFEIKRDIFTRHVWQPTLEYFLPVQMCHMTIKDRYKTWHGLCHMDDAVMAPINRNHFDGYYQDKSTYTEFNSGDHVPGLNIGGWHDAGDYDLRVESQAGTIYKLALAYECFASSYDETSIDQKARIVRIHKPDGIPDILQQIEHGVLSIVSAYESMGRLYRGIQDVSLEQYVHLGDASTTTDNLIFGENKKDPILGRSLSNDDRLVFTEINPQRELYVAQVFAAASRTLKTYRPGLSDKCLNIAEKLYKNNSSIKTISWISAASELYLTTSKDEYKKVLENNIDSLCLNIEYVAESIGKAAEKIRNPNFTQRIESAVKKSFKAIMEQQRLNPYGVPYRPYIWGAGWTIQSTAVKQLFLHLNFPKITTTEYIYNAINFILGCHPGENTASFVSGVGVNSLIVAYGVNRDEWSYIPGGVASGTALIRPDLPELKVWPYFWQQTEYVMGGGALDFMLLTMAADQLLNDYFR
jgi:endoglucanase